MKLKVTTLLLLLLTAAVNIAQTNVTPNILKLDEGNESSEASIDEVAWIAGHWKGEALGGIVEEVWTKPLGGSMMCAFKLVVDNKVKFYELCSIYEENNTLQFRLKHFNYNLKGWEEKDETVDFPFIKLEQNKAYFDGFTFEKVSDNEMNIYVLFGKEGSHKEMKFNYKK